MSDKNTCGRCSEEVWLAYGSWMDEHGDSLCLGYELHDPDAPKWNGGLKMDPKAPPLGLEMTKGKDGVYPPFIPRDKDSLPYIDTSGTDRVYIDIEGALEQERKRIARAIWEAKPVHMTRDYTDVDQAYDRCARIALGDE